MSLHPGQRLDERYVLSQRIASGGMGEVWSGTDEVLDRPVAVKVLRSGLAAEQTFRARFRAEARTAGGLTHGSIAAVFDYGEIGELAYLVMELVDGEPLSALLAREGALGIDATLDLVAQAARALHAAHLRGVVHRDVKPANLLITPDFRVKVTDFGIARPRDHEPLTATGQVMGTAHYLAPELARGEVASPLSDVYALGIVAYECLAGRRPFEGTNQVAVATAQLQQAPPPLPETVPADVREAVFGALAKRPEERPRSAQAFAVLLEDLLRRRKAGARASAPTELIAGVQQRPRAGAPGGEIPAVAPPPAAALVPPSSLGPKTAVLPVQHDGESGRDGGIRRWRPWRRRSSLPLLLAVLVLGVMALGAAFADDDDPGAQPTTTPAATTTALPSPQSASPSSATTTDDPTTESAPPTTSEPTTTSPTTTSPDGVIVVESDYLGRDVKAVSSELRALGLRVEVRRVRVGRLRAPDGTVVQVGPTGLLVSGSTVTVVAAYERHRGGG
jgi:serine/threonine-protein kinase